MPIIPILVCILILAFIIMLPVIIRATGDAIATARFGGCDCDDEDDEDDFPTN